MGGLKLLVLLCFCVSQCSCDYTSDCKKFNAKLDQLIVTWSPPNVVNPLAFARLPRTTKDALAQNWKLLDNGCAIGSSLMYKGARYILGDDVSVLLIIDGKGNVAGIQTTLDKDVADSGGVVDYKTLEYVYSETIKGKERYVMTTYFMNPSAVCTGRSDAVFKSEGTTKQVYFKSGTNSYLKPPLTENSVTLTAQKWTKGLCVPTMGHHYYFNTYEDQKCADMKPDFIMYHCGYMVAVGMFVIGNFMTEPRYEFVPKDTLKMFINPVPKCIYGVYDPPPNGITSMHIFFVDPQTISCP